MMDYPELQQKQNRGIVLYSRPSKSDGHTETEREREKDVSLELIIN